MSSNREEEKRVLLIVRDGWGYSPEREYNYIAQANTKFTDQLEKEYPTTLLKASGREVGLPDGYMGNSEVGHMTIGAGRVLKQSLLRINDAIEDGSFFTNEEFLKAFRYAKEHHSRVHMMGLLQKEGVHAHFNHLIALLEMAKENGFSGDDVFLHVITDGRDAKEQNAIHYLRDLEKEIARIGVGKIVTLSGRYYAMDRNKKWERTEKYYNALFCPQSSPRFSSVEEHLLSLYKDASFSDEFLIPVVAQDFEGIQGDDVLINYSFRKDRERQISHAVKDEEFPYFSRCGSRVYYVAMTEYYKSLKHVAYPDLEVRDTLGEVLANLGKGQLRIAETEKYAHVTFFFDGGREVDFPREKKIIIPSPDVPTYDLKPEMSSKEITETLIQEIETEDHDFILCNFANADMVGHTGEVDAILKAVEAVDVALSKIVPVALKQGYIVILTGDHGNAEHKHGKETTSHTKNPVPTTVIGLPGGTKLKEGLGLKNLASTILSLMKLPAPDVYEEGVLDNEAQ